MRHLFKSFTVVLQMGYAKEKDVVGAHEYDKAKEKGGFVAGKHINKQSRWWFQFNKSKWVGDDDEDGTKT